MAVLKESETEDRGGYSGYVDSFQHVGRVLDFSEIVGRGKLAGHMDGSGGTNAASRVSILNKNNH
jgi:hypothetical protein